MFLDNVIAHLVDYSVVETLICTRTPKIHLICFIEILFIVVVWNRTCHIFLRCACQCLF